MTPPFADRLAALVEERRSQICLGLDPDPATLDAAPGVEAEGTAAAQAGASVAAHCRALIAAAGEHCVAVKPQLACFERLGAPGWAALVDAISAAREAGLLVVADGKRNDVPVSAAAYGQMLFGETPTPFGEVSGIGADAATANPLLGGDALDPLISGAADADAGLFVLVRTSNPGAADLLDMETSAGPLHERLASLVSERAERLAGESGLTGMGAVVGATEPGRLARLRELMPRAIFLMPGVGAQGGRVGDLGPALGSHPASVLVAASRSIAGADDPGSAADRLRAELWSLRKT